VILHPIVLGHKVIEKALWRAARTRDPRGRILTAFIGSCGAIAEKIGEIFGLTDPVRLLQGLIFFNAVMQALEYDAFLLIRLIRRWFGRRRSAQAIDGH
jgi:hypothetical protein